MDLHLRHLVPINVMSGEGVEEVFAKEEFMFATPEAKAAIDRLAGADQVTVLTGAGMSVASGIMPFRGKGGLWEKYDPEEAANIDSFKRDPRASWVMLKEILEVVAAASPNSGHYSLARLESLGVVNAVITQNIDGLHQEAGSKNVIEFHGNTRRVICLGCRAHYPTKAIELNHLPPLCPLCGGVLKPDVVFFGEPIPKAALLQSQVETNQCQVMLVIGTSGMVDPAASLPLLARSKGALVIEVNPAPSQLTAAATDVFLEGRAEQVLPMLVDEVEFALRGSCSSPDEQRQNEE